MKAEDKLKIYTLLRTAARNVYGYTPASFSEETPVFEDSPEAAAAEPISAPEPSVSAPLSASPKASLSKAPEPPKEAPVPEQAPLTVEDISAKIARCTRCQLARTRTNTVPGVGVKNPLVMIIGEGPGADEDAQGIPFVGKAGQLLDKMLAGIRLDRKTNCYIANVVKCRPPQNRDPYPDEADACIGFLEAQIKILKPKMILCVGRVAAHNVLKTDLPMNQMRGKEYEYNKIPLFVTYHPSALLRDESLKRPAWDDLRYFGTKLKELSPEYAALFSQNS